MMFPEPLHLDALFGLIALPVLAPIVALLQLLFPGLMRNQYEQYKRVIHVVLTQSTLMFAHWGAVTWFFKERRWWLSDEALGAALLVVAALGLILAFRGRLVGWKQAGDPSATSPTRMEYITLSLFVGIGLGWIVYQLRGGGSPLDPLFAVTVGCLLAIGHLLWRTIAKAPRRFVSTELVMLAGILLSGTAIAAYSQGGTTQRIAGEIQLEHVTFRGDVQRTGARSSALRSQPKVLWECDLSPPKGRVRLHATPTVVDGVLFVGGMHQVLSFTQGLVACIDTRDDVEERLIWKFTDDDKLKSVFSSPSVAAGRLYFGEGYHQDAQCRLFCLDARRGGKPLWTFASTSHVESPPTIDGGRIFVGAGDDGLLAFDLQSPEKPVWRTRGVHVDSSPLAVEGKVVVGSVLGDIQKDFVLLAVNAANGEEAWRITTPYPVPGAPAYTDGKVFVTLGRGKMDHEDERPAGAVWCIDLASGERKWEYPLPAGALNAPAVSGARVIAGCRDGNCYALDTASGDLLWKVPLGEPIVAAPAIAGDTVIISTVSGVVAALDLETGREQWRTEELQTPDNDAFASPVAVDGRLYMAVGAKVFCLGDQ